MVVVISVPRLNPPTPIAVVVVITKVVMAIPWTHPQMSKGSGKINDDARTVTKTDMRPAETTRCKDGSTMFPAVVPIAWHEVTAVHASNVVVRNPDPIIVTGRPESRTPNVSLISILPTSWHPEVILGDRLSLRSLFKRFRGRWQQFTTTRDRYPTTRQPTVTLRDLFPLSRLPRST